MDDLTAFLNARLDEDEAAAFACATVNPGAGDWVRCEEGDDAMIRDVNGKVVVYDEGLPTLEEAIHIARHDPARVLREVEAKRAILDRHAPHQPAFGGLACDWCSEDVDDRPQIAKERWPCPDVLSIAAIWGDHAEYRPEWGLSRKP